MLEFLRKLFGSASGTPSAQESLRTAQAGQAHAERGQRRSDEEFAQLVAGVRDYAVFLLDAQGHIRTWNAGAERIKGYRAEEIIGSHFSRFYPNDAISSGWPAHELEVAAATGRFEDEGWRVRKDGSMFWANVVITALRDESGVTRGFLKITRDLTDRKQAEEKLRLSEERFRLIVEGVKDYAIFMLDPQGNIATWNAGAERLKGYTASEIIGQHFSRFYPQEALDRGWPAEELRRATAEGRVEDEGWRVRKDGSRFWANVVITALRDSTGVLRGFAKVTRDLSERKESEENARRLLQEEAARQAVERHAREIDQQREQLHVTLTSIGDAVIVTDLHGVITFINPVAVDLTGWTPQDAVGRPLGDVFRIINEETREAIESPVVKVLREGVVVGLANHTVLLARDGREIPIDDSGAPIRGGDGSVAGVVLVFRDVTEARRAIETRLHLAAIVESSDDAIISKNLDGIITSWNRGAERLYGYKAEEIVGKPLTLLVPSDHPDELPEIMARIKRGERVEHFETERVRKNGTRVPVSLSVSPIINAEGKVIGASKIARDISARKEEERRRNEFLAMLAHELRNPLAPLRHGVQILRLAADDPAAAQQACGMMERQLRHLVRLVDDLLDVSRISRGKLQLHRERIALSDIVSEAVEFCAPLVQEQGDELIVTLPDRPVYVDADKTRLTQVLSNLLLNAVKYSDRGCKIWLTAAEEAGHAVLRVKDTGIGIAPDMLPRVFELFTQLDASFGKTNSGLGVGLTIVKRLVEMHGGAVAAHSEGPGKGSEFVVRLPLAPPNGYHAAVETPAREEHYTRPRRILVVDDNLDAANGLAMILRLKGHEVHTAGDGLEGLQRAEELRPDLILLDIGMPRMNGYDACKRIREQPWGNEMVLVALSGWGQEDDKRRSLEAGFDHHLVKPVEGRAIQQLLETIQPRTPQSMAAAGAKQKAI